jgi:hypothetical protein
LLKKYEESEKELKKNEKSTAEYNKLQKSYSLLAYLHIFEGPVL